jgi:hypothetical protein
LPFGGRHQDSNENLSDNVTGRLERNAKLRATLSTGAQKVWVLEDGLYRQSLTIPFEFDRLLEWAKYVARGLARHHWGVTIDSEHFVAAMALTDDGAKLFRSQMIGVRSNAKVDADLSNDTFRYEGAQGIDNPQVTAWLISFYGGAMLGGDVRSPKKYANVIGVITGSRSAIGDPSLLASFGPGQ